MRALAVTLGLALVVGGCGGDQPRGVQVTEADEAPLPPVRPRRSAGFDSVYADSGPYADLRVDSLRLDSLRRDSVRASTPPPPSAPAAPDFGAFWPRFRDAARAGRPRAEALAAFSSTTSQESFERAYATAFSEPFRAGVLALTPRDFRRDGAARQATVVVGYDAGGRVVPQDEAVAEASATLRFDVVDGAYRLVGLSAERR